jgi:hypothetical protein
MVAALINQPPKPDQIAPAGRGTPVDPQNNPGSSPAVGAGVTGASPTTSVPPAPGTAGDPTMNYVDLGAAFASLLIFLPRNSDPEVATAEAMCKLSAIQQKSDNELIKVDFSKRQEVCAAKLAAAKDMQKQLDSVKGHSWWDAIKVVCEVIVVALAVVAACTGVGAGLSALLITALWVVAVAGAASLADEALQATTGHGVAGNVCIHICGGSEEDAREADMIHSIVLGVAQLAAGIVCLCLGDGHDVVQGYTRLALALGSASGTVGAAVVEYQNAGHQAEAKRDRAREQTAQATLDQIDEFVQQILKRMTTNMASWGRIQEDVNTTLADRNYQTARIRFA